jgi:acetylglutamate kinase
MARPRTLGPVPCCVVVYGPAMQQAHRETRTTIVRLLSNIGSAKEIQQYLKRFSDVASSRFAVIKVGGAILREDMDSLASSLSFLHRVGLIPIVVHGAGPQIDQALAEAGIPLRLHDGLRVTPPEVLAVARRMLAAENIRLVDALQQLGTRATGITSGVFECHAIDPDRLGRVGDVDRIHEHAIMASIHAGALPVLASLGETADGQILHLDADAAARALVRHFQPYKVIFLTRTGGIADEHGAILPAIHLSTDYDALVRQPSMPESTRIKLEQIRAILDELPASSSVSITRPDQLARELFTHRGSGTLVRRGEHIDVYERWADIDLARLEALLESSFRKPLAGDYFERTRLHRAYVTRSYRAAALLTLENGISHLDKFAVSDEARGEGLGRATWVRMRQDHPKLYWRSRRENPINDFYFQESDGCVKGTPWNVFWYGFDDFAEIARCVEEARQRPATIGAR